MKQLLLAAAFAAVLSSGNAMAVEFGEVRDVRVNADGAQTFKLYDQFPSISYAACATEQRFAILDENSAAGRSQMAQLIVLSSITTSPPQVRIQGLGTCTRVPGHEDVDYIEIP